MTSGNGLDEPEPCGTWTTHSRSPWAVWITSRECCGGRTSETSPIDLSQREVQTNNKAIDPNIIIFDFLTLGPTRMLARVSPLTQLNDKSPLEDMYTLLLRQVAFVSWKMRPFRVLSTPQRYIQSLPYKIERHLLIMPIQVSCQSCQKSFRVKDDYSGKKIRCPSCKGIVDVPFLVAEMESIDVEQASVATRQIR